MCPMLAASLVNEKSACRPKRPVRLSAPYDRFSALSGQR